MQNKFIPEVYEILTPEEVKILEESDKNSICSTNYGIFSLREKLVKKLTWIYPSVRNFELITKNILPYKKVLDIGCGSGILGKYLEDRYPGIYYKGIRVNRYDVDDIKYHNNIEDIDYTDFLFWENKEDFDVWVMSWPPYNDGMAIGVLEMFYQDPNAKRLLYIGELDGCNGDEKFNSELAYLLFNKRKGYKIKEIEIDSYSAIRDDLFVIDKT